jgi:hypothetical protein
MLPTGDRVAIGRVTIRAAVPDPSTIPRVAATLSGLDLRPAGFRDSTILVIRKLADPAPRGLSAGRQSPRRAAWEAAARERIGALQRRAPRPGVGPIDADAEAVVFADEGELLASYALDAADGALHAHWWWAALGRAATSPRSLPRILVERAALVPAMVTHLDRLRRTNDAIRSLSDAETQQILGAMCRAFAVPDLPRQLARPERDPASAAGRLGPRGPSSSGAGATAPSESEATSSARSANDPWPAPTSPAGGPASRRVAAGGSWDQHVLVAVARTLARSPAAARAATFPDLVRATWHRAPSAEPARARPERSEAGRVPTAARNDGSPAGPRTGEAIDRAGAARSARPSARRPVRGRPIDREGPTTARGAERPDDRGPAPRPGGALHEPRQVRGIDHADGLLSHDRSSHTAERPHRETAADPAASGADLLGEPFASTEIGGVAFLVNLMAYLDLPDAFEDDWRLASTVGAWGTLELLTRGLLGSHDEVSDDELWQVLAALEGRGLDAPTDPLLDGARYRLPLGWIGHDHARPGCFAWSAGRGRLRAWSRSGFLVLDEPGASRDPDPERTIRTRLAALGIDLVRLDRSRPSAAPTARLAGSLVGRLSPATTAWLGAVLPYVRRRLAAALGRDRFTRRDASGLLLHPARVHVSATHVDVVMSRDAVSIAVRLAGLDRDPGWLPSFGRIIKIHFE